MAGRRIAIVDYGAGNLWSIHKALEKVCLESGSGTVTKVLADPSRLSGAEAVVLPGVGAAGPTMNRLRACGLVEALRQFASSGRPFLGICLGLQLLFPHHAEGDVPGLGILPGRVKRLDGLLKVPHIGWNLVEAGSHPMFAGIGPSSYFYYVHSYFVEPGDRHLTVASTCYGASFSAAVARGNLWGVQFHPEKSGPNGLRLLRNFVELVEAA